MLILTSKTPWRRRPSGLAEIDQSSLHAQGLKFAMSAAPGMQRDLAYGVMSTSSAPVVGGDIGFALNVAGANPTLMPDSAALGALTTFTISAWVGFFTATSTGHILQFGDKGSAPFTLGNLSWNGGIKFETNNSGTYLSNTGTFTGSWETWHHFAATVSPSAIVIYQNGMAVATVAGATPTATTNAVSIGYSPVFNEYLTGQVAECRVINRAYSSTEVWSLYAPETRWSLYAPLVRRVYFDLAAGGGGSTFVPQVIMVL